MAGVLSGYRVLDFGRYISGPFCAALLADMGADVIRVEPVDGSDDRYVMPIGEAAGGGGALHYQVNRGKRSLAIDWSRPAGRAIVDQLIARSDVVIANMPPAALAKLGLDHASLKAIRPDMILTSVNAYGPGSYADAIGFDGTGQALSGAMALTGTPDQPFRAAVSYVDFATAMSAALGTVAALLKRERSGEGDHVHCSLLGTALTMSNAMLIEEASGARSRIATGNRSPIAGPSDLFRTRDGWVMVQVIGQQMFGRWTALVDRAELVDDARFADDQQRGENGEELSRITAEWAAGRSSEECLALLRQHRLPATPLLRPADTLHAPEVIAGDFLHMVRTQGGADIPIVSPPCGFAAQAAPSAVAPALGSHTIEILREIGLDEDAIARLRSDGVVAQADDNTA